MSDFQRTEQIGLTLSYRYSPKLNVSASVSQGVFEAGTVSATQGNTIPVSRRTDTFAASIQASYRISPFMFGTLGYRYTDQTTLGSPRTSNLITLGLSYNR